MSGISKSETEPKMRLPKWQRYLLLAIGIAVGLIVIKQMDLLQSLLNLPQLLLQQVQTLGVWAPVGFILLYNIATVLLIPGSVLTLGGGLLFGVFWGTLYVIIAAMLGAIWAFLIGRYWARDWVAKRVQQFPKFQAIDRAIGREGLKIVLLTRLSPIFPFNLLNYALGITGVSLFDYIVGSLGIIPGTLLYVYIGSLSRDVAMLGNSAVNDQAQIWKWVLQIVGFVATIGVTVYITKVARAALNESLDSSP